VGTLELEDRADDGSCTGTGSDSALLRELEACVEFDFLLALLVGDRCDDVALVVPEEGAVFRGYFFLGPF
jgi:hypothetical protein